MWQPSLTVTEGAPPVTGKSPQIAMASELPTERSWAYLYLDVLRIIKLLVEQKKKEEALIY